MPASELLTSIIHGRSVQHRTSLVLRAAVLLFAILLPAGLIAEELRSDANQTAPPGSTELTGDSAQEAVCLMVEIGG